MKINYKIVSTILTVIVFGLLFKVGVLSGELSGLEIKTNMLLEVACSDPESLNNSIDKLVKSMYEELSISISYYEFRNSYKWPCE